MLKLDKHILQQSLITYPCQYQLTNPEELITCFFSYSGENLMLFRQPHGNILVIKFIRRQY